MEKTDIGHVPSHPANGGIDEHGGQVNQPMATPPEPEPPLERVDMPAGSVLVCEPYDAGGGFTCFEWFLDGRVKSAWSSEDLSGGYPRPLNTEGLFGSRSARPLQDRLDTYMTYLLVVVISLLIAVIVAKC